MMNKNSIFLIISTKIWTHKINVTKKCCSYSFGEIINCKIMEGKRNTNIQIVIDTSQQHNSE